MDELNSESTASENPTRDPFGWVCQFLATGFSLGSLMPVAPGTLGTAMGIPLAWGLSLLCQRLSEISSLGLANATYLLLATALCWVGVPICTRGQRRLGKKDPGEVIWDELASVPLVFFALPFSLLASPWVLLIGFVLHRIFDISKPPPCRRLECLPEGWGVMLDDVAAAVYGCVVMHVLYLTGLLDWLTG